MYVESKVFVFLYLAFLSIAKSTIKRYGNIRAVRKEATYDNIMHICQLILIFYNFLVHSFLNNLQYSNLPRFE